MRNYLIVIFAVIFSCYLFGSFVTATFNIYEWSKTDRIIVAVICAFLIPIACWIKVGADWGIFKKR